MGGGDYNFWHPHFLIPDEGPVQYLIICKGEEMSESDLMTMFCLEVKSMEFIDYWINIFHLSYWGRAWGRSHFFYFQLMLLSFCDEIGHTSILGNGMEVRPRSSENLEMKAFEKFENAVFFQDIQNSFW